MDRLKKLRAREDEPERTSVDTEKDVVGTGLFLFDLAAHGITGAIQRKAERELVADAVVTGRLRELEPSPASTGGPGCGSGPRAPLGGAVREAHERGREPEVVDTEGEEV